MPNALTALTLAALSTLVLAGCGVPGRSIQAASPVRHEAAGVKIPTSAWPQRLSATTPAYEVRKGNPPRDLGVYARCHILQMGGDSPDPILFFSSRTTERLYEPRGHLKVSLTANDSSTRFVTRDHRITLVELEAALSTPSRGTIIYLASIMGLPPQEQEFIKKLRQQGWNVAACLPSLDLFYRDAWPDVTVEQGIPTAARELARRIDGHLAERAYAAEALLAYLKEKRPEWLSGPRVVIGSSAGAIALPAVVARIGEVDAAVLIGGGAHLPRIMMESWLRIYEPVLDLKTKSIRDRTPAKRKEPSRSRPLTPSERAMLQQIAFEQSRLDPSRLAPVLNQTPTLMLSARYDRIVPAENGELLYESLRRPERWSYPVGHVLLFVGLASEADEISDWLEFQLASRQP